MPGTRMTVPAVHARAAPADAAGGGGGDHRERGDEIGRQILVVEAGHVQFAGRDHGGGAAVQVIADPADGVLGRRPFAEHRMDVAVDQARHHRAAAGVEHGVGAGVGRRIERRDGAAFDQQRFHRRLRLRDVAGEELADVLDEERGHRRLRCVSRARCGAQCRAADPGPRLFTCHQNRDPASAVHRSAALRAAPRAGNARQLSASARQRPSRRPPSAPCEASFWCFAFHCSNGSP